MQIRIKNTPKVVLVNTMKSDAIILVLSSFFQIPLLLQFVDCSEFIVETYRQKSKCPADENESWSYRGNNGPESWANNYPDDCSGSKQSPIQINSRTVEIDRNLGELHFYNYDIPLINAIMENNGHTIEMRSEDDVCRLIIVNDRTYKLHQLHFHWGSEKKKGAEHIIDKVVYPMEMHLIHLSEYGDIAVVAVFFQQQKDANEDLKPLVDALSRIKYKGTKTQLNSNFDLNKLLPENPADRYYRYEGSLTTPDCMEGVTWSLLLDPIPVGNNQMKYFRQLFSTTKEDGNKNCKISNNYRPVQPLNGRKVYSSQ